MSARSENKEMVRDMFDVLMDIASITEKMPEDGLRMELQDKVGLLAEMLKKQGIHAYNNI